ATDSAGRRCNEVAAGAQAAARRPAPDQLAGIHLEDVGEDVGGDDVVSVSSAVDRVGRAGVYRDCPGVLVLTGALEEVTYESTDSRDEPADTERMRHQRPGAMVHPDDLRQLRQTQRRSGVGAEPGR